MVEDSRISSPCATVPAFSIAGGIRRFITSTTKPYSGRDQSQGNVFVPAYASNRAPLSSWCGLALRAILLTIWPGAQTSHSLELRTAQIAYPAPWSFGLVILYGWPRSTSLTCLHCRNSSFVTLLHAPAIFDPVDRFTNRRAVRANCSIKQPPRIRASAPVRFSNILFSQRDRLQIAIVAAISRNAAIGATQCNIVAIDIEDMNACLVAGRVQTKEKERNTSLPQSSRYRRNQDRQSSDR